MLDRPDHAAVGNTYRNRNNVFFVAAVVDFGELGGDLVVGGEDEPVELNLGYGPIAAHRHADGGAHNTGLSEGRIHHALLPVLRQKPFGYAVYAAEFADIFTDQHDFTVICHRVVEAASDRFRQGQALNLCILLAHS